ncbi:prepilin peptidase [Vibrio splendidus]|uniref:prepilin peptidase n=1 Tax=Vibrio splendidus TaxID=29497 RepID=UPI003D0B151F
MIMDLTIAILVGTILGKVVFLTVLALPEHEENEIREDLKHYAQSEVLFDFEPTKINFDFAKRLMFWVPFGLVTSMIKDNAEEQETNIEVLVFEVLAVLMVYILINQMSYSIDSVFACLFISLTVIALIIDITTKLLPEKLTYTLMWSGLLYTLYGSSPVTVSEAILGATLGYLILYAFNIIHSWWKGDIAWAYGDLRLISALGAWLGFANIYIVIFIALTIGVFVNLVITSKNYPFAPVILFSSYLVIGFQFW